ncbi:MAG: 4Fe-4S dicluster domain-containing protein [Elusimicrobia bacterium]|nr:4Fe-4S dicluster domain-containing protein [Elusimicrobiota bacterium]
MSQGPDADLADAVRDAAGVRVERCYQCGKCTAGCPMARHMDLAPNQIMRLAQTGDPGDREALLRSLAIWCCAGCLTCTQRCPRELDPAAVIDALRELSRREGKVSPRGRRILAFHEAFLASVEHTGRMSEVPLVGLYKLWSGDIFQDLAVAPAMLARGKLPLIPHVIKGRTEIRRIFEACRAKEKA